MFKNMINWMKNNKFATVLILILGIFAFKYGMRTYYFGMPVPMSPRPFMAREVMNPTADYSFSSGAESKMMVTDSYAPNVTPQLNIANRKYITNDSFSLQVKNVTESVEAIKAKTTEVGGYLVNTYLNRPEFGEDATVTVRIPNDKLDILTTFLRQNAVKVVSENINKNDITDQYVDIQERLKQLNDQKASLIVIMRSAKNVEEMIQVKTYLDQIQNEIDSYTGQSKYLENSSASSLVTIYLSTDELGLPYTPANSWRPQAIFKEAVRSLIATVQNLGSAMIWLGVYSVIIIPALTILAIILVIVRRKNRQ